MLLLLLLACNTHAAHVHIWCKLPWQVKSYYWAQLLDLLYAQQVACPSECPAMMVDDDVRLHVLPTFAYHQWVPCIGKALLALSEIALCSCKPDQYDHTALTLHKQVELLSLK